MRLTAGRARRAPTLRDADPSAQQDRRHDGDLHRGSLGRHPRGAREARPVARLGLLDLAAATSLLHFAAAPNQRLPGCCTTEDSSSSAGSPGRGACGLSAGPGALIRIACRPASRRYRRHMRQPAAFSSHRDVEVVVDVAHSDVKGWRPHGIGTPPRYAECAFADAGLRRPVSTPERAAGRRCTHDAARSCDRRTGRQESAAAQARRARPRRPQHRDASGQDEA